MDHRWTFEEVFGGVVLTPSPDLLPDAGDGVPADWVLTEEPSTGRLKVRFRDDLLGQHHWTDVLHAAQERRAGTGTHWEVTAWGAMLLGGRQGH